MDSGKLFKRSNLFFKADGGDLGALSFALQIKWNQIKLINLKTNVIANDKSFVEHYSLWIRQHPIARPTNFDILIDFCNVLLVSQATWTVGKSAILTIFLSCHQSKWFVTSIAGHFLIWAIFKAKKRRFCSKNCLSFSF